MLHSTFDLDVSAKIVICVNSIKLYIKETNSEMQKYDIAQEQYSGFQVQGNTLMNMLPGQYLKLHFSWSEKVPKPIAFIFIKSNGLLIKKNPMHMECFE